MVVQRGVQVKAVRPGDSSWFSLQFQWYATIYEETPRRRITVTSSLNEISWDKLGNRVVVREGGFTPAAPTPF